MLLAEQVDRHRQRRALGGHLVERVQRLVDGQRDQPPPRAVHQPHVDDQRALRRLAAVLGAVQVGPRGQRHVVADAPGHVVDELVPRVLEHDGAADRVGQLGQDLRHAAPVQDQLGEAAVDLLAPAQQLELAVQHGGVHGLGDLDEPHLAAERDQRHAGVAARVHDRLRDPLAPRRAELDGHADRALLQEGGDPARLVALPRARSDARGEHELAALEQVARVGHLDHMCPAQLTVQPFLTGDHLRQGAADDGQLEYLGKGQHTFRQSFWNNTRRSVHCVTRRETGRCAELEGPDVHS